MPTPPVQALPPAPLDQRFNHEQLTRILQQSAMYFCACPAQVCMAISQQRALFAYQAACLNGTDTDAAVHLNIAETARTAHARLELCLDEVLDLEGWDRATLTMPENLQKRLLACIQDDAEN